MTRIGLPTRSTEAPGERLPLPPPSTRARLVAAGLALLGSCSEPDSGPLPGRAPERPNVLFVSVDTLAAEHLSLYGYGRPTSPLLEAFAADSIVFEDAIANAPWTLPSYVSQFSGLYPDGLRRRSFEREGAERTVSYALPAGTPTLSEVFAGNGYRTAAWVDNPWLSPAIGIDRGFDRFDDEDTRLPGPPTDSGLRTIAPEVTEWIEDLDARPFFAFVHCIDTHAPYWTGGDGFPGDGRAPRTPDRPTPISDLGGIFGSIPAHALDPAERLPAGSLIDPGRIADRYDAGIRRLDEVLGEFLGDLEQRGLLENTIVVISSDHGESVGQHGWYFDHALLYEDTLRVPLVLRLPRGERRGLRVAQGVEMVDLFPTLAELCELEGAPVELDGRSLVGHFVDGVEPPPERARFSSALLFDATAIHRGSHKLISTDRSLGGPQTLASTDLGLAHIAARAPELFPDGPDLAILVSRPQAATAIAALTPDLEALFPDRRLELYDLAADPGELANLWKPSTLEAQEMLALLDARRAQDALRRERFLSQAPPLDDLDADVLGRLQELGYLGTAGD